MSDSNVSQHLPPSLLPLFSFQLRNHPTCFLTFLIVHSNKKLQQRSLVLPYGCSGQKHWLNYFLGLSPSAHLGSRTYELGRRQLGSIQRRESIFIVDHSLIAHYAPLVLASPHFIAFLCICICSPLKIKILGDRLTHICILINYYNC